jgi:hypothetical protein
LIEGKKKKGGLTIKWPRCSPRLSDRGDSVPGLSAGEERAWSGAITEHKSTHIIPHALASRHPDSIPLFSPPCLPTYLPTSPTTLA